MKTRIASMSAALVLAACGGGGGGGGGNGGGNPPAPDSTAPQTSIDMQPAATITTSSATFTFSSDEAGATFQYGLDGGAFTGGTSPLTLTGLADGAHTLTVRARDAAGNVDATPATAQWTVDATPPQTSIDAAPAPTTYSNSTSITFSGNEAGVTFEGRLDGGAFAAVSSPVSLAALADGAHVFEVRARDAAGNTDATPATVSWTVLAGAPDTAIDGSPAAVTSASSATFAFSSNKPNSTFAVSVDGGAFTAASSPHALSGLAPGAHTFAVRATDDVNQPDATPATFNWIVDVTPPTARILFPMPVSYTDAATLTVRGTASDANGVGSVSVNGVAATSIDGFENWRANVPLSAVTTTVTVSVTDAAGNVTAGADSASVVNRGPVIGGFAGLDFDPNGNQVIALDQVANAIYGFRATDGIGHLISPPPSPGANPGQYMPTTIAVDATRNRALFIDYQIDALVAADLATGTRSLASPSQGQGSLTSLVVANNLALDPANNRAFATNDMCHCIIGMDLNAATRSIVASATVGTGVFPPSMVGLVYDNITTPGTPRLLTSSWMGPGAQEIIAIDVATGNRTVFSSFTNSIGTGPDTGGTMSLRLDPVRHRLVTADNYVFGVMAVDLATGNRTLIMNQHMGSGPLMYPTVGAAYDPASNRMFSKQTLEDEIIASDLATLDRAPFIQAHLGTGPEPNNPDAVIIEQPGGAPTSLVYTQIYPIGVLRLDLATGARTMISDSTIGTGPNLDGLVDLVLDTRPSAGPHKALALLGTPNNRLLSIDLISGDRVQVADLNSVNPAVTEPRYLKLDAANNRVLFSNGDYNGDGDALYAIDLATGTRSVISDANVGGGFVLDYISDFVLDPAINPTRVLLSDAFKQTIVAVNLASGHRTVFSTMYSGGGELQFNAPGMLHLDTPNSRLLGLNGGFPSNLFSMSLPSTAQRLISGPDLQTFAIKGAGPTGFGPGGLAVDNDRGVVYVNAPVGSALVAIDLVSGDRVIIAN